ncbi:hypothetical protein ColLi_03293 [Colletotrichum liriopes]|uniref:Uncharacterized protein n=1 Tax=Colletotrichum liriopes TaxID=708192 RepID=A0AA37LPL3_9PEZI|nr:hypothetical protein ColLi_03293 [Colletotrichum liriopes]
MSPSPPDAAPELALWGRQACLDAPSCPPLDMDKSVLPWIQIVCGGPGAVSRRIFASLRRGLVDHEVAMGQGSMGGTQEQWRAS